MVETLKKFMTAIFFVNRTLSYRYVTEDNPEETQSLLDIPYSVYYHKTATEFVYRIINLFSLYLQKCNIQEETNKVIKAKVESYKQYAFELCLSVISVCEWLNEGNEHYDVVKYTQEATLRNIQSALDGKISANSLTEIFRRYDKSIQDIEGFAKGGSPRLVKGTNLPQRQNSLYKRIWLCGFTTTSKTKQNSFSMHNGKRI